MLRSATFRRERQASWMALEALIDKIEAHGTAALRTEEIERLPVLYRAAASSLSVARAMVLDRHLLLYLENLSLRAFLAVYAPRTNLAAGLFRFVVADFRQAVRGAMPHILLALLCILAGTLFGYLLVDGDEAWFGAIVPQIMAGGRGASSSGEELLRTEIFAPWPGFAQSFVVFANTLFQHNTLIGLMTFGLGLLAGVPTVLLLVYQGLSFGAFLALHAHRHILADFLGWVAVHGVTEFGAIILCGAGGLVVAEAMLFPGRHTRQDNLAQGGRRAAVLVCGAIVMFLIAGLIEGGFRQLIGTTQSRFACAAVIAALWTAYFVLGRRPASDGS